MPKPISIFFSLVIVLVLAVAGKYLLKSVFSLQEIRCVVIQRDNQEGSCPEDVQSQLNALKNSSIFWTSYEEKIANLGIELYELTSLRKYVPQTIEFRFIPSGSAYLLRVDGDDKLYRVTQTGMIATDLPTENLLEVRLHQQYQPTTGQPLDQKLHAVLLNLTDSLKNSAIPTRTIEYYKPDFIVIRLEADRVAIVDETVTKNQIEKLEHIQAELQKGTIDTQTREIDLRFKLPVLRNSTSNPG